MAKKETIVNLNPELGLEGSVMRDFFFDECHLVKKASIGINMRGDARKFERGARVVIIGKRDITKEVMDDINYPYQPNISTQPDISVKEYSHIRGRTYNTDKGPVFVVDEIKNIEEEEYNALKKMRY